MTFATFTVTEIQPLSSSATFIIWQEKRVMEYRQVVHMFIAMREQQLVMTAMFITIPV